MRYRYKPNKDEFFFKKCSLACYLYKNRYGNEEVHIYDRKTHRIIMRMEPALVTLSSFMDLTPIKRPRNKK